jgi:predicted peptidase
MLSPERDEETREYVFEDNQMCAVVLRPVLADDDETVILYLHGWGESGCGTGLRELQVIKNEGKEGILSDAFRTTALDTALIFAPQCPPGRWWDAESVWDMFQTFLNTESIRTENIVVVGISMGGFATYKLIHLYGSEMSSAVIIAGGDDPRKSCLSKVGLWLTRSQYEAPTEDALLNHSRMPHVFIVHGTWDPIVPISSAHRCIERLSKYTHVQSVFIPLWENWYGLGHQAWRAPCCRNNKWWMRVIGPRVEDGKKFECW